MPDLRYLRHACRCGTVQRLRCKKLSICKNHKKSPQNAAAVYLIYELPLYIAQLNSANSIRYKTSEQQKNSTSQPIYR
jgi:hypothetical protein